MDWPFLGRDLETDRLVALASAASPKGALVVGPPGIGKSRLLEQVAQHLISTRIAIRRMAGSPDAGNITFGAISSLLTSSTPVALRSVDVHRLAFTEMRAVSGRRPIVFVDDAHLLDDASAALVYQLAVSGTIIPIISTRSPGPLPPTINALWARGSLDRIDLRPLESGVIDAVILSVLGDTVHPLTRTQLHQMSGGNPLLLREAIAAPLDSGYLDAPEGSWWLREGWEAAPRIGNVSDHVFGRLSGKSRKTLEDLAIAGPLETAIMDDLGHQHRLERLEAQRLVRVSPDGERSVARLMHPFLATALVGAMPSSRQRRVRRRLVEAVGATRGRRTADIVRLATWKLDIGDPVDVSLVLAAARASLKACEDKSASRFASAAADGTQQEFKVLVTLGTALTLGGRSSEAEAALALARAYADTDRQRARATAAMMRSLAYGSSRWVDALQLGSRATKALDGAKAGHEVDVAAARIGIRLGRDPLPRRAALVGRSPEKGPKKRKRARASRRSWNRRTRIEALLAATEADYHRGKFDRVLKVAASDRAEIATPTAALPLAECELQMWEIQALAMRGALAEAESAARAHLHAARLRRSSVLMGIWAALLGSVLLTAGRIHDAAASLDDALLLLGRGDPLGLLGRTRAARARVAVMLGDNDLAVHLVPNTTGDAAPLIERWSLDRAGWWLAATHGNESDAAAEAARAGLSALEIGYRVLGLVALHDAARLGHAQFADEATKAADAVDGPLLPAMAIHLEAVAAGSAERLRLAAEAFSGCGARMLAAEAFMQAAAAYGARKNKAAQRRCEHEASSLLAQWPEIRSPALTRNVNVLTAREAEIARFAAAGTSSKRIAKRLDISNRTVDNHLASVYAKLGVGGRDQLADILGVPHESRIPPPE